MTEQSNQFLESYQKLEEISKKLQGNQNKAAMLDELAPMLEEASKSYRVCKERIDAVKKQIEQFKHNSSREQIR